MTTTVARIHTLATGRQTTRVSLLGVWSRLGPFRAGESHLPGIKRLWESSAWRASVEPQPDSGDWRKCVFQNPPEMLPADDLQDLGALSMCAQR